MTTSVSWSGGKDCCQALRLVRAAGLEVTALVTFFDETGEATRAHGVPRAVMQAQADALGLRLVAPSAAWADYERVFAETIAALKRDGVISMVFGDIDLQPHRDWIDRMCAGLGIRALLPLWRFPRAVVAQEAVARYKTIVVATDDRHLDASLCGRAYDADFLAALPKGVCPCGEDGEFHTFVTDGPGFRSPVPVKVAKVEAQDITFADKTYRFHFARLELTTDDRRRRTD
jgi:diphthine-ammonia ligase